MCISTPKIPDPPPPPKAPPPPTAVAKKVKNKELKKRDSKRTSGVSVLTIPRTPTINTGSTGSGANIY